MFPTADGHLIIAAGNDTMYQRMCEAIGRADLGADPRYQTNPLRNEHHDALIPELNGVLEHQSTDHWLAILDEAGVPASAINDMARVAAHPQVGPRNMLVEVPDETTGTLEVAGNPIKISGYADPATRNSAPDLDRDRAAILEELAIARAAE